MLDAFVRYSEAKEWDELLNLYHYPLTFVWEQEGAPAVDVEFEDKTAAAEILPDSLFIHGRAETEEFPHTYAVRLEERATLIDGDPNTMSAMMEFTKVVGDDSRIGWHKMIAPSINTFTFVRVDSEWKIERHVYEFLEPEYIGPEDET